MRSRILLIPIFGLCVFSTLSATGQVRAATSPLQGGDQMVFTFQGTATGSFQPDDEPATAFASKPFTIIATANPDGIVKSTLHCAVPSGTCMVLVVAVASAIVSVDGVTATIESRIAVFDNQTFPSLGLKRQTTGADLLDFQSRVFEAYGLNSDLRPTNLLFETPRVLGQFNCAYGCLATRLGTLMIDSVQNVRVTATHANSRSS